MIAPFRLAFASARVRALKSRLLGAAEGAALLAAADAATVASLVDPGAAPDARELERRALARVVVDYEKLVASCPGGRGILLALFRRHETENLKLAVRAALGGAGGWAAHVRPLGRLGTLPIAGAVLDGPAALLALAAKTPYEDVLSDAVRAHAGDAPAIEAALDRWTALRIVEEARRLPRRERRARELALAWVRERDADLLLRRAALGLGAEAAVAGLALLKDEARRDELLRLAEWRPGTVVLTEALPRVLLRLAPRARDADELRQALAAHRRTLCRRAFLGNPFRLGPAVAYLFLREEEARAVGAIASTRGRSGAEAPLSRALAASLVGG